MALCPTLNNVVRQQVMFNPNDVEHLKAFKMLCVGENGPNDILRQHPTLRFVIEQPFSDVRTMMYHQVCTAHIENKLR